MEEPALWPLQSLISLCTSRPFSLQVKESPVVLTRSKGGALCNATIVKPDALIAGRTVLQQVDG